MAYIDVNGHPTWLTVHGSRIALRFLTSKLPPQTWLPSRRA